MLRRGVLLIAVVWTALAPPTMAQSSGRGTHDALIAKHAAANGVPETLVRRVIRIESRGNPKVVSKGNYGLMQIRLGTARAMGYTGSAEGLLDADTNMTYAVRYLAGAYRAADGNQDRAVAYYQRGYHASAKAKGFSPYARPRVQPQQVAQAEVQPRQPSVAVTANTTPIPVRTVTPEIIRRPKSQAVETAQQAPLRAPAGGSVRTQAWEVVATVPLPPARLGSRETRGSPAPQPAQAAPHQQPPLALPHLAVAPPGGTSNMAAPLQPVESEPLPQMGAAPKTAAARKAAAAPKTAATSQAKTDAPRPQQAAAPQEPKLAAVPPDPKLAAAPQPRVAMTPDAIVASRFPVELAQRAQPVMALQPVAELRQQQVLATQPPAARASADETTGTVRAAARSEPPPAQAAPHEQAEEPKVRRSRNQHSRRSSRSRRHAAHAQQPSLLAGLQSEVSKNAAPPRARRQVRTVRRSSTTSGPTNLLAYLKKAVTPEKPRRRR